MGTSTLLFMMPFSVIPCATERNGAFKFLAVTGTDSLFLGDDAMGVQGSQARLAGMLAGGVWFRVVRAAVIIPADVDASVLYSAVLGGVVRPL